MSTQTTHLDALDSTYSELVNALGHARRNGFRSGDRVTDDDVTRDEYSTVLRKLNTRNGSVVELSQRDMAALWDALAALKLDQGRDCEAFYRAEAALADADEWATVNGVLS